MFFFIADTNVHLQSL